MVPSRSWTCQGPGHRPTSPETRAPLSFPVVADLLINMRTTSSAPGIWERNHILRMGPTDEQEAQNCIIRDTLLTRFLCALPPPSSPQRWAWHHHILRCRSMNIAMAMRSCPQTVHDLRVVIELSYRVRISFDGPSTFPEPILHICF